YLHITVFIGVIVNVVLAYITNKAGLPLYFDTIGTISVAILAGAYPAILTAVISNIICSLFSPNALYFSFINVLVAIITAEFSRRSLFKNNIMVPIYILIVSLMSGILGIVFQWLLFGSPQFDDVTDVTVHLFGNSGVRYFLGAIFVNTGLNIVDKSISGIIASLLVLAVPKDKEQIIMNSGWKQTPLSKEEIKSINKSEGKNSLLKKMTIILSFGFACLVIIMSWISIKLFFENEKNEGEKNALKAARFVSEVVDGDRIDVYANKGREAEKYEETENLIREYFENSPNIMFLYVIKIDKDGVVYVFDMETEDVEAYQPGEKAEFEEAFDPYLPALFAGERIDPIISDDVSGWVLTVYEPIKDSTGNTTAYACADVSMVYLSSYAFSFIIKVLMIFSSFFVLLLSFVISYSGYYLSYPISSMTVQTKDFINGGGDQQLIDKSVKKMSALNVRTNDEVEELYKAICKMESDMAEQMRDIRHYAESTQKMQNGLIVTMADMVESRDSDTGEHILKTAAYVRIVLDGLQSKGYYAEKITPKFIEDCVMSAPLHDVGKINIPDAVLNKPGKLTDEEFEIMKTHTTAGKLILEKAISTVEGENYLKEARNMAAYHHERWDGRGYPEKLHGEVIPLSARVMAVADVFDALTSPRVYKPAFPLEKALAILNEGSGTQFDPKVIEVFMENLNEVKKVLKKYHPDTEV
ncbi:MAG: HD domain-containing protein, partial [Lachnospiraceae bacterium]|nr:HD domain-containing protein [Lachnospiraceae bacterium]